MYRRNGCLSSGRIKGLAACVTQTASPFGCFFAFMSFASVFQALTVRSDAFLSDLDDAVFPDGDGHAVLDIAQKFVAKLVNNGHFRIRPDAAEYCARHGLFDGAVRNVKHNVGHSEAGAGVDVVELYIRSAPAVGLFGDIHLAGHEL